MNAGEGCSNFGDDRESMVGVFDVRRVEEASREVRTKRLGPFVLR